jgi:hypothetical protein
MTEQEQAPDNQEEASAEEPSEPTREWLLKQLRRVMEIALGKVTNQKTAPSDRIKWSRIVIAAGASANSVLRDVEIAELRRQITELKELIGESESEEGEDEYTGNDAGDTETQEED